MSEAKKDTQVELGNTGEIELPSFDAKPYIGKKTTIAKVEEHRGNFGYYCRVETEPVTTFGEKAVCASKIFGLQEDAKGNIGWGADTKLGLFLAKYKVAHYRQLVGKEVILITRMSKDGNEFLDFN